MRLLLCVLTVFLGACGVIQDRSSEYVQATRGTQVLIPEGLSDRQIQSQYPIPDINNKRPLASEYELPKPPNATAALDDAPFTIDQVEDQVWLRLFLAPGKVWPLLDAFWQDYGFETIEEDISNGYLVTNAVQTNFKLKQALSETAENDFNLENVYFQAQLRQGIRRNTSEIKLRVLDLISESPSKKWKKVPVDIERDKAVLNLIGKFITSDALQNRYSLLANTIGGESRIQLLQNDDGYNYLLMALSPQRAWNELGKALKAAEILVSDKDISANTYYVSYINESEISQWFMSEESLLEKKQERNFSIQLKEQSNGAIKVEIEQLNDAQDSSLKNDLLDLIFEHIS